ncbi:MAG: Asp-tRNA(Asn)/Glu-tRNA(Gln) amidotransferase GatCAB subunit C [Rhodospirillales bacterium CG15_BIG_FIL_POST_REV_8_21_14_020_66_15]|nr:MAG: Asp-tRNA(Asn)/Glu-tRNA(Gln) amidotransferase GatCAB subunit C [Rhodospirillales bacterium CG15_BIG_FIL_POST_REV_8_21_14_020_66_15]
MSLDKNDVRRVAFLARIRVDEDDLEPVARDLNNIIGWVEQLAEVDTDGVEPLTGVTGMTLKRRDDVVTDGGDPDKVLRNAPDRVGDFYAVPKVVE